VEVVQPGVVFNVQAVQAVIFDMDGVLIDSEPLHFIVLNEVLARGGHALSGDEYEAFIGTTTEAMWSVLVQRFRLPASAADYIEQYNRALLRALEQPHPPQPGVLRLLRWLRERGIRLGVASSSPRSWIDATLRSIGLDGTFEAIVSGDDVTPGDGKPSPTIYRLAATRLSVRPSRCVAIEDSPNGVLSARRAGMRVIGVRTPVTAHLPLPGAERIVESLCDLHLT
jgi:HAD superfamily hydrolase (TIGR01509 family)